MIFAGTAEFSLPSLRVCAERCDLVAVVTQPDRLGHRGKPAPRPVADMAAALGVPIHQPPRLRQPEVVEELLGLGADALVVAAYGQIVPVALLDGHRHGGINVHGSILPRWRGAAPIAYAILHGDGEVGVSIMRMEAGLDTGPVFLTASMPMPVRIRQPELSRRLSEMGAEALGEVLGQVAAGTATAVAQDDGAATLAPRLRREDGVVDWSVHDAMTVDRMVRALDPWPGVTATVAGTALRLLEVEPVPGTGGAGEIVDQGRRTVDVATCVGRLRLVTVQPPGRRPMDAAAFLRGLRLAR